MHVLLCSAVLLSHLAYIHLCGGGHQIHVVHLLLYDSRNIFNNSELIDFAY